MNGVPNSPAWREPPNLPKRVIEYYELLKSSMDRHCGALPTVFHENRYMPKDQIWMIDSLGKVHKIINIANYLDDNSAISLCVGEMK